MIPPSVLVVAALLTLAFTLWAGYATVLGTGGDGTRPVGRSMPSPATAVGGWVGDASVVCPHCRTENRVTNAHCAGCRAPLSPEWPVE
ncbi:hypothetical protein [Halomarina litorea]|uniref:hypothetical protein n=1 Tax=Halomarina litorea TaxID=2961595 RepID=UPI0020C21BD7|nr:hypothetical protein [Halomarina sp. BCD28]